MEKSNQNAESSGIKNGAIQTTDVEKKYGSVRPFPLEVFHPVLRKTIETMAETINCPPDFIAAAYIGLVSVCIGNRKRLRAKHGWDVQANLFLAIVADPGSKKSPALAMALKPLEIINRELKKAYDKKVEEVLLFGDKDSKPPKLNKTYTTDSTTEALMENLVDNPGMINIQDELSGLIGSFNAYRSGNGSDKEIYLSLFNGSPVNIDRKSKESISVRNPFLSIIGNIPPDVLVNRRTTGKIDDGFLDRFLYFWPLRMKAKFTEIEFPPQMMIDYIKVAYRIFDMKTYNTDKPKIYSFSTLGYKVFRDFIDYHHAESNDPAMPKHLIGVWSKFDGQFLRLCLILQLISDGYENKVTANDSISSETVTSAISLMAYFKSNVVKVYTELYGSDEEKLIARAIQWLENQGGSATVRQFVTGKVAGCKTRKQADELLYQLQIKKIITRERHIPERGGQPSEVIILVKQ